MGLSKTRPVQWVSLTSHVAMNMVLLWPNPTRCLPGGPSRLQVGAPF
jgi:hypothetical protein